jgi:ribosomal protein L16 Arg81 hydroxylase
MYRDTGPFDLARLLAPVDVELFASRHWEHEPLVLQGREAGYYDDLLSLSDADHLLAHSSIQAQSVRIVRDGQDVPLGRLRSAGANTSEGALEALYQEYRDGSTIVLSFLHERWPPLRRLCQSIASETSAAVQVNVYITPPGAQGLGTHYDNHDVFVLQVAGSKHWRLFGSPTPLPLPEAHYHRETAPDPGPPLHDLILTTGDLLYIPRGYLHSAASLETYSLHLTVGIRPVTWASVIRGAIEAVLEEEPLLRSSLPLGFANSDDTRAEIEAQMTSVITTMVEHISVEDAIGEAYDRARAHRQPSLDGHLEDLCASEEVGLDTPLRLRPDTDCTVANGPAGLTVDFHGKRMGLPTRAEPAVRYVTSTSGPFTARDVPGPLTEEGALVLLRRMVREGLLTTRPQRPPI